MHEFDSNNDQWLIKCSDSTGVTFTQVMTLDTFSRNTYYFDTTNNMLWLIISAPTSQFSWYWGLSFPSGEYSVLVTASCADNCVVPALSLNNLPVLPQPPAPTPATYCENSGPYPLNGQVKLTTVENAQGKISSLNWIYQTNSPDFLVHNVFLDQFENTWDAM